MAFFKTKPLSLLKLLTFSALFFLSMTLAEHARAGGVEVKIKAGALTGKPGDVIKLSWSVIDPQSKVTAKHLRFDGESVRWKSPYLWKATPGTHVFHIQARRGKSSNARPYLLNRVVLEISGGRGHFKHPGIYNSQKEFEVIKANVNGRQGHPMKAGWKKLLSSVSSKVTGRVKYTSLKWKPHPVVYLDPKTSAKLKFFDDSQAAYAHALQWVVTGDKRHAEKSIEIYNAWSYRFKDMTTANGDVYKNLFNSWAANTWVAGAEIIRHYDRGAAGWQAKDIKQFEKMCRTLEVLLLEWKGYGNGCFGGQNQDVGIARTRLAMGIFLDDQALFDSGTRLLFDRIYRNRDFVKRHGHGVNLIGSTVAANGEIMEFNRDAAHGTGSINSLAGAAEILRHQDVAKKYRLYDLKMDGDLIPRLLKGSEFAANSYINGPIALTKNPRFINRCSTIRYPEMTINYYKYLSKKKYTLQQSIKAIDAVRPLPSSGYDIGWSTLTHGELSAPLRKEVRRDARAIRSKVKAKILSKKKLSKRERLNKRLGIKPSDSKKVIEAKRIGIRFPKTVDPKLPNILIAGDSICSGYSGQVSEMLKGKANVYVWATGMNLRRGNITHTQRIALGVADFSVVHFNIGLHGLGNRIPQKMYEPLMRRYVHNFQIIGKGSRLIWASTTPVWNRKTLKLNADNAKIVRRNKIAKRVMSEAGMTITDLYGTVIDKLRLGGGIHWSRAGYHLMAEKIVSNIQAALLLQKQNKPEYQLIRLMKIPAKKKKYQIRKDLPATIQGVPKDFNPGWMNYHRKLNKIIKQSDADLIFVGDSITNFWSSKGAKVWQQYYAKRNAVNLGMSGDRTQHVLWRLKNGNLDGISPKLAIVMIGTNNARHDSPKDIAAGIKAIVDTIELKCPTTRILLLGIFPRGRKLNNRDQKVVDAVNQMLPKLADNRLIFYMNINAQLLNKDGTLSPNVMPDYLHPNAKGYQIWAEAIEQKVKALMEENDNQKIKFIHPGISNTQKELRLIRRGVKKKKALLM